MAQTITATTAPARTSGGTVGYSISVSTAPALIREAQRLRHHVFTTEPGFRMPARADGLDADEFDAWCEHLVVREDVSGEVVGCYRMLPPDAAARAGRLYTAGEFDVASLDPIRGGLVEMGRACVRADHRNGAVLAMMWAGIFRYTWLAGYRYATGCVSVPMDVGAGAPRGADVRGIRDLCLSRHAADPRFRMTPHVPVPGIDDLDPVERPRIPPLLQGYLRIGARVCGEPAYDPEFDVADFPIIVDTESLNTRYLERLTASAGIDDLRLDVPRRD